MECNKDVCACVRTYVCMYVCMYVCKNCLPFVFLLHVDANTLEKMQTSVTKLAAAFSIN
jgi:hypothetical protein